MFMMPIRHDETHGRDRSQERVSAVVTVWIARDLGEIHDAEVVPCLRGHGAALAASALNRFDVRVSGPRRDRYAIEAMFRSP